MLNFIECYDTEQHLSRDQDNYLSSDGFDSGGRRLLVLSLVLTQTFENVLKPNLIKQNGVYLYFFFCICKFRTDELTYNGMYVHIHI